MKGCCGATAFLISYSAAAATAAAESVTAYSEEDDKCNDDEPNDFILKKITEAVHIYILSFYFLFWRTSEIHSPI